MTKDSELTELRSEVERLKSENEDLKRELEILNGAISASIDILSKKAGKS